MRSRHRPLQASILRQHLRNCNLPAWQLQLASEASCMHTTGWEGLLFDTAAHPPHTLLQTSMSSLWPMAAQRAMQAVYCPNLDQQLTATAMLCSLVHCRLPACPAGDLACRKLLDCEHTTLCWTVDMGLQCIAGSPLPATAHAAARGLLGEVPVQCRTQ